MIKVGGEEWQGKMNGKMLKKCGEQNRSWRKKPTQERLLTVSVVEDNDAPLFGLGLLRMDHGGANEKIHRRVLPQATWQHAQGVLTGKELMGVKNWWNKDR